MSLSEDEQQELNYRKKQETKKVVNCDVNVDDFICEKEKNAFEPEFKKLYDESTKN